MQAFNRIPIVATLDDEQHKILVPHDWALAMLLSKLREKIQLQPHEALFLFSQGKSLYLGMTVEQAHTHYADEDKVLRITIKKENVFG